MYKRLWRLALITMIFVTLFASFQPAEARLWQYGDDRLWSLMRNCRDGAVVLVGLEFPGGNDVISFTPRHFLHTSPKPVPIIGGGGSYASGPYEDYGPTISSPPSRNVNLNLHSYSMQPLGFEQFAMPAFRWNELLQPDDDRIIMISGNGTATVASIEDCSLSQFYFTQNSVLPIGSDRLDTGDNLLSPSDLTYRLEIAPSNGALRLNGLPMNAGDIFTQTDINAGLIDYFPNGAINDGDYFEYSLTGLRRISVSTAGVPGNGDSYDASISADGSQVAFSSAATNLVEDDSLFFSDVFIRDLPDSSTTRVSVNTLGQQGNGDSYHPDISPDGEAVAFASLATNLVSGDLSVCEEAPDDNFYNDIYVRMNDVRNIHPWQNYRYSVSSGCGDSDGDSYFPAASNGGEVVAFETWATNLISPPGSFYQDVYKHNTPPNGDTAPVSVAYTGGTGWGYSYAPSITDDGVYVAFSSEADDLVADDTNGTVMDIFVRGPRSTVLISRAANGDGADGWSYDPAISADGRFVAFSSNAWNLADHYHPAFSEFYNRIFIHDRDCDLNGVFDEPSEPCQEGYYRTTLLPAGYSMLSNYGGNGPDGDSYVPVISADGRFVAFDSYAGNLVEGDGDNYLDVFVVDRDPDRNGLFEPTSYRIEWVSRPLPGRFQNGNSYRPAISDDGMYVAFTSYSSNLVTNDTNSASDIFLFYTGATEAFPILTHMIFLPVTVR